MVNLSGSDRKEIILALMTAIGHENQVLERLQKDDQFRRFSTAIGDRREQIERFERLLEKLRQP